MAKGGSKVLTGVIAFLLGFIFAILVEVGAVFGVYLYVTNTNLDKLFSDVGLQNKDEDGNYVYINTDAENGGASTVGELFSKIYGFIYSEGASSPDYPVLGGTLDDIENLLPVVNRTLAEKLYPVINEYVEIDWDEFESTAITELPTFLSDSVMDIRPAVLLEKFGMNGLVGEGANVLVNALLAGVEFEYATTQTGLKFPVFYDVYTYDTRLDKYYRGEQVENSDVYPDELSVDWLYETSTNNADDNTTYRLYFVPCKVNGTTFSDAEYVSGERGNYYAEGTSFAVVKPDEDGVFALDTANYKTYDFARGNNAMEMTGNFYFTNADEEIQIHPVTIRSFSDENEATKPLYSVSITQMIGNENSDNKVLNSLFGKTSVGELIDGKVDLDDAVSNLELASVINIDPEQAVMAYIGYGMTNVSSAPAGSGYDYTATVKIDGVPTQCYVSTEMKQEGDKTQRTVTEVWYYDGVDKVVVKGTTVKEVSTLANDLEITALVKVKADDAILGYIGYGLSGVTANANPELGYTHTGTYKDGETEYDCFINTDEEGVITDVWYVDAGGEKVTVGGTTVNGMSDRISGVMDNLTLPDVIDIDAEAIMAYMGYGITGLREESGEGYTHVGKVEYEGNKVDCYIATDETNKITSVWIDGNVKISGTPIGEISDRVSNLKNNLTLADVIAIPADDAIMTYMGYGLTGVHAESGEGYSFVGEKDGVTCYIKTDGEGNVAEVWSLSEGNKVSVTGTVIADISTMISALPDNLTLPDVMDVEVSENIMVYMGYGVTKVAPATGEHAAANGYTHYGTYNYKETVEGVEVNKTLPCYLKADENGIVTSAWYTKDGTPGGERVYLGTKISEVSQRVSGLSDDLTLGDVMDIDESDTILYALKDEPISNMGTAVKGLKIKDVLKNEDIEKSAILKQLQYKSIDELSTAIDSISIQSIYKKEVYGLSSDEEAPKKAVATVTDATKEIAFSEDYVYFYYDAETDSYELVQTYTGTDETTADDMVGKITAAQFAGGVDVTVGETTKHITEFYTYGPTKGMWRLILQKNSADRTVKGEKVYTLNNFNNMVSCCTANINDATLGDLADAGIIHQDLTGKYITIKTVVSGTTITKYVAANGTLVDNKEDALALADMPLKTLIDVVLNYMTGGTQSGT